MALPKVADARKLSDEELEQAIIAVKRELFDLRLKKATRQSVQPHQFVWDASRAGSTPWRRREQQPPALPACPRARLSASIPAWLRQRP